MMKFKRKLCAFSVAAVMSLSVCAPAFAAEDDNAVDLQFNGVTTEDAAVLVNDTAYISAAEVKNVLGIDCAVTDGKAVLTVNGNAINVDADLIDENLIPVRAIANALGYSIGWDSEAKTAVVIDVDKLAADNGETFDIIGKYMDYSLSVGMPYESTSEFNGNVVVVDPEATLTLPFNGTTVSVVSDDGEDMTMNLTFNFDQIKEVFEAQGMDENEKAAFDAVINALGSSETKILYDLKNNVMYMNSSMFTVFGIDANAWVSLDLGQIFGMASTAGADLTSILDAAMSTDLQTYIVELLKALPVESVNTYNELAEAYEVYCSMLGDSAFVLEDGKYTLNYAINQDGAEVTYSMVLGTDGDAVNSCDLTMKLAAEDMMTMDITASTDKDFNTTMTFAMNMLDMLKMDMNYTAKVQATTQTPQLTVPEGAVVISLNDLLFGTVEDTDEIAPVPEAEASAEAVDSSETEVPAEATETVDETAVPAETTETEDTATENADITDTTEAVETTENVEAAA